MTKSRLPSSQNGEWGTYCYKVMPFGLKNAGETYQRVVTALFHDMMHKEVEVYVDYMIIKSEMREGHFEALDKFLARLKNMRKVVRAYSQRKRDRSRSIQDQSHSRNVSAKDREGRARVYWKTAVH